MAKRLIMYRARRTSTVGSHSARTPRQRILFYLLTGVLLLGFLMIGSPAPGHKTEAQSGPVMLDPNLLAGTLLSGLVTPISIAFPAPNQLFVLEKNTGKVKYLANGS